MENTEFCYPTWEDAADAYIDSILEQLRDTWPACVLPPTWKQLREEISDWLDYYETSAEPWPDDPDGKLWDKFIDEYMEMLRPKIEAALKGYEDSDFVKNFWGAGDDGEK